MFHSEHCEGLESSQGPIPSRAPEEDGFVDSTVRPALPFDVIEAVLEHVGPNSEHAASTWLPVAVGGDGDSEPQDKVLDSLYYEQATLEQRLPSAPPLASNHLPGLSCNSSRSPTTSDTWHLGTGPFNHEASATWQKRLPFLSSSTCSQEHEYQEKQSSADGEVAALLGRDYKQESGQGVPMCREFESVLASGHLQSSSEQLLSAILNGKAKKLSRDGENATRGRAPSDNWSVGSQPKTKTESVPALSPLIHGAQSSRVRAADVVEGPEAPFRGEDCGAPVPRAAALKGNEDEGEGRREGKREGREREREVAVQGGVGRTSSEMTTGRNSNGPSCLSGRKAEALNNAQKTVAEVPACVQTNEIKDVSISLFQAVESWAKCNPAPTAGSKRRPLQDLTAAMGSEEIKGDLGHHPMGAVLLELTRRWALQGTRRALPLDVSLPGCEAQDLLSSFLESSQLLLQGVRPSARPPHPPASSAHPAPRFSIQANEFLPPVPCIPSVRLSTCVEILSLAHAFQEKDERAVVSATKRLTQIATPYGHFYQRVAAYALKAFELKRSGKPLTFTFPPSEEAISEEHMNNYLTRAGWFPFAEIMNTSTLIQTLKGYSKVHIILLSDGGGIRWSMLFNALSRQAGGAPSVHVTCLRYFRGRDVPHVPMPPRIHDNELVMAALQAGVPLEHNILRVAPEDFNPDLVKIGKDEALAVAACWHLLVFPDDKVLPMNPRNSLLRWIHWLSPKALIMTEPDADFNSTGFLDRMDELVERRIRICEAWDSVVPQNAKCRPAGELLTMQLVIDCIANEGAQLFMRDERLEQWLERMGSLGFELMRFPDEVWPALANLQQSNQIVNIQKCGEVARFLHCGSPCLFSCAWIPV